jgi:hypothetical protein
MANTLFTRALKAALRCGSPLIAVKTPDQAMTIETIKGAVSNGTVPPILVWDCVRGVQWANEPGLEVAWKVLAKKATAPVPRRADELDRFKSELGRATINIVNTLEAAGGLPDNSLLIVQNMQWQWDKAPTVQAAWNLRDPFKGNFRTLIMLTDMGATIPAGLRDALPLAEELPTLEELGEIVDELFQAMGLPAPPPAIRTAAVDAVCGLPAFSAEQSIALSFTKGPDGVSLDTTATWARKKSLIEQTNGLSVYSGPETYAMYAGNAVLKQFGLDIATGEDPFRAIVLIDEINDALAGSGADGSGGESSGTTQKMHGTLLARMENKGYSGIIEVGPTGTGKTAFPKALAGETKRPLIIFDISKMESKFVGSSNENLNACLDVVDAISQGHALFIATCNAVSQLTPQLKGRFTLGTFYVDLPDETERPGIWDVWLRHFKLDPKQKRPDDTGWNGREIKACCSAAWRLRKPLLYAAQYITHAISTDAESIDKLRRESSGRFLSASYPGCYTYGRGNDKPPAIAATRKRNIRLE